MSFVAGSTGSSGNFGKTASGIEFIRDPDGTRKTTTAASDKLDRIVEQQIASDRLQITRGGERLRKIANTGAKKKQAIKELQKRRQRLIQEQIQLQEESRQFFSGEPEDIVLSKKVERKGESAQALAKEIEKLAQGLGIFGGLKDLSREEVQESDLVIDENGEQVTVVREYRPFIKLNPRWKTGRNLFTKLRALRQRRSLPQFAGVETPEEFRIRQILSQRRGKKQQRQDFRTQRQQILDNPELSTVEKGRQINQLTRKFNPTVATDIGRQGPAGFTTAPTDEGIETRGSGEFAGRTREDILTQLGVRKEERKREQERLFQ